MAFIDFENINIPARNDHKIRHINFNNLREILLKDLRCVGCIVYLPNKMRTLLAPIQKSGLEVKVVSPGKSIDGRLIFDLLRSANRDDFDVAVIASGDRDYIPVIEEVKRMRKKILIGSFSSALAHGMRFVGDEIIDLDKHVADLSLQFYEYDCISCKKKFEIPIKLRPNQKPICRDCMRTR